MPVPQEANSSRMGWDIACIELRLRERQRIVQQSIPNASKSTLSLSAARAAWTTWSKTQPTITTAPSPSRQPTRRAPHRKKQLHKSHPREKKIRLLLTRAPTLPAEHPPRRIIQRNAKIFRCARLAVLREIGLQGTSDTDTRRPDPQGN